MTVRRATSADLAVLEELWGALEDELSRPPYVELDRDREAEELRKIVDTGLAFLAERGRPVGFALARHLGPRLARLTDLYVVPDARRDGVAAALVAAVAEALEEEGIEHLDLEVQAHNTEARTVYQHWGFTEQLYVLGVPLATLRERLAPDRHAESFASIHVQTDAVADVERAVREFAPRIASGGSQVVGPRNGWIAVYDELTDRNPEMLRRLAREISDRMGAVVLHLGVEEGQVVRFVLFERGRVMDEYLSVP